MKNFILIFPAENKNVKKPKKQKKKNKYEQKSAWDQLCGTIPRVSRGQYTFKQVFYMLDILM